MTRGVAHVEASTPIGALFVVLGVALVLAHATVGVFTGWSWAILTVGLVTGTGTMLLFPDVRLYQFDRSPLEQLVTELDERTNEER